MSTKAVDQGAELQFRSGCGGVKVRGGEGEMAVAVLHGAEGWKGALRNKQVPSGAQKKGLDGCERGGYVRRVVQHRRWNRHLTSGVSGERSAAERDGMRRPVSRRSLKISCKEDGLKAQKGDRP